MNRFLAILALILLAAGCLHVPHGAVRTEEGEASYYSRVFEGRRTASGAIYRGNLMTCAHRSFPFGTRLRVTNLKNGRSVIVRVNDRGPFIRGRIIDLSWAAAKLLGFIKNGGGMVRVESL